jgi:LysM repeat protein
MAAESTKASGSKRTLILIVILLLVALTATILYFKRQSEVVRLLQVNALQNQRLDDFNNLAEKVKTFNSQFGARFGRIHTIENLSAMQSDIEKIKQNGNVPGPVDSLIDDFQNTLDNVNYLGDKIEKIEKSLGSPHVVKSNENHASIALDYLTTVAELPPDEAKKILKRTALIWELEPGNEVYNLYYDGIFLTTVSQGSAKTPPLIAQRRARDAVNRRISDLETQLKAVTTPADTSVKTDSLAKPSDVKTGQ